MNIKESMEGFNSVEVGVDKITEAAVDGKINWLDSVKIIPVVVSLKTAIEGSTLIPAELADLDSNEIKQLTDKLSTIVTKFVKMMEVLSGLRK